MKEKLSSPPEIPDQCLGKRVLWNGRSKNGAEPTIEVVMLIEREANGDYVGVPLYDTTNPYFEADDNPYGPAGSFPVHEITDLVNEPALSIDDAVQAYVGGNPYVPEAAVRDYMQKVQATQADQAQG